MKFSEWKALLLSNDTADRAYAADELPDDGDDKEVETLLIETLKDQDPFIRACAVDSQKAFDTEKSRNAVRQFLKIERDSLARAFAISTLGSIGDSADLTQLSREFENSGGDQRVRDHCSSAIIALVIRSHLKHLMEASEFSDAHHEHGVQSAVALLADAADQIRLALTHIRDWTKLHPSSVASPNYREALRRLEENDQS